MDLSELNVKSCSAPDLWHADIQPPLHQELSSSNHTTGIKDIGQQYEKKMVITDIINLKANLAVY